MTLGKAGKGGVAIFWDLGQTHSTNSQKKSWDLPQLFNAIRQFGAGHGPVKRITAYSRCVKDPAHWKPWEAELYQTLATHTEVKVQHIPRRDSGKSMLWHGMEIDIAFHFFVEHPEHKTAVLITGEYDLTYLTQKLRARGVKIVILVVKNNTVVRIKDANAYFPRPPRPVTPPKKSSEGKPQNVVKVNRVKEQEKKKRKLSAGKKDKKKAKLAKWRNEQKLKRRLRCARSSK